MTSAVEQAPATRVAGPRASAAGPSARLVRQLRAAAPALAVYAGLRVMSLLVFFWLAAQAKVDPLHNFGTQWDSEFYNDIARHGYPSELYTTPEPGRPLTSTTQAFFPLYPLLMRWLALLPGVSVTTAGVVISCVAALAAAWGLFKIGSHLRDARTGVVLAGLWAVFPAAGVQQAVYTESLFMALAVWALYAGLRHRWVTAGLICIVCGLTRPTAASVIGAVGLAALVALFRRTDGWRPVAAMVLAPLGLLSYFGYLAVRYGRVDTYFVIQKNIWGETFDGGKTTWNTLMGVLPATGGLYLLIVVTAVCLLAVPGLTFLMLRERLPLVLLSYGLASLVLVLGVHHWAGTIPRYLMPVFPLLIPLAYGLAKSRLSTRITVLLTLGVASGWYAGWLVLHANMAP
ncbi:mannosyltransferase family protein [Kitasatospora sp. GP82]|uniref:mannosyltransferase family protein n=1 Tax=Kitasatospora sp. GP82 TaxID=3035089 RepID=UPI0024749205|nr:mannosyltransferase family protein [Kitasatospora sp. GP82]MDH6124194.1 hypothetical protein [Kitasatospora sp. GP82]